MKRAALMATAIGAMLIATASVTAADQLRSSISHQFQRMGIDGSALAGATANDVSQVQLVLSSGSFNADERAQVARILSMK
jgi:hypothetical protein